MSNSKGMKSNETRAATSMEFTTPSKKIHFDPRDSIYNEQDGYSTYTSSIKKSNKGITSPTKEMTPLTFNEDPYFFSFNKSVN
jgi:hypothetical protein